MISSLIQKYTVEPPCATTSHRRTPIQNTKIFPVITTDGNVRKRLPLVSDCDHFWITALEFAIVFPHPVSEHLGRDLISLFETTHIIVTYKLHAMNSIPKYICVGRAPSRRTQPLRRFL